MKLKIKRASELIVAIVWLLRSPVDPVPSYEPDNQ